MWVCNDVGGDVPRWFARGRKASFDFHVFRLRPIRLGRARLGLQFHMKRPLDMFYVAEVILAVIAVHNSAIATNLNPAPTADD